MKCSVSVEFEPKEDFSLECYVRAWKLVPERAGALSQAALRPSIALFSLRPGRSKGRFTHLRVPRAWHVLKLGRYLSSLIKG